MAETWTTERFLTEYKQAIPDLQKKFSNLHIIATVEYPRENATSERRTIEYITSNDHHLLRSRSDTAFENDETGFEGVDIVTPEMRFRVIKEPNSPSFKITVNELNQTKVRVLQKPEDLLSCRRRYIREARQFMGTFQLAGAPLGQDNNYPPDLINDPRWSAKKIHSKIKENAELVTVDWERRFSKNDELQKGRWIFDRSRGWMIKECRSRLTNYKHEDVVTFEYKDLDGVLYPVKVTDKIVFLADGLERIYQHETVDKIMTDISPDTFLLETYTSSNIP